MTRELALEYARKYGIETVVENLIDNMGVKPAGALLQNLTNITAEDGLEIARKCDVETDYVFYDYRNAFISLSVRDRKYVFKIAREFNVEADVKNLIDNNGIKPRKALLQVLANKPKEEALEIVRKNDFEPEVKNLIDNMGVKPADALFQIVTNIDKEEAYEIACEYEYQQEFLHDYKIQKDPVKILKDYLKDLSREGALGFARMQSIDPSIGQFIMGSKPLDILKHFLIQMTSEDALEIARRHDIDYSIGDSIFYFGFELGDILPMGEALEVARKYGVEVDFEDKVNNGYSPGGALTSIICDDDTIEFSDEEEDDEVELSADEILDQILEFADYWIYHQSLDVWEDLPSILREIVEYSDNYMDGGFYDPERTIEVTSRLCKMVVENYYYQSWTLRPNGRACHEESDDKVELEADIIGHFIEFDKIYHKKIKRGDDLPYILQEIVEHAEDYIDGFDDPEQSIVVISCICKIVIESYYSESYHLRSNSNK